MSFLSTVRSILGITPVKVGDLAAEVAPAPATRQSKARLSFVASSNDDLHDVEVIPEYKHTTALLDAGAPLLFVTGGAGTGKSILIRFLRKTLSSRLAVVAPTGVAALNAGGTTINSLFRLPPRIIQPQDVQEVYDRQLYTKLQLLIIDEVSMVRPDLLDGVDRFLRLNRQNDNPFGGVQVLLIGDLFQLPPVVTRTEQPVLRSMGYSTEFFFGSRGIADCPLVPLFLTRVFRQSDAQFIALLNTIREGNLTSDVLKLVNARCVPTAGPTARELVLTCTNDAADKRNSEELSKLPCAAQTYTGTIEGEFHAENDRLPSPLNLTLKPGAQVMFTKNDDNKRWVNGSLGHIVELGAQTVRVELDEEGYGEIYEVSPATWEQYKYEYDPSEDRIVAKVVGLYTQLPLMLAWAVTIHKAQGKTLSKVFVDFGHRAFAPGQVYVALSRVRALQDIRLARPIREEEVRCDRETKRFYHQLLEMTQIQKGGNG